MNITEFYHSAVNTDGLENDFKLYPFREGFNIGYDSTGVLCIVIKAMNDTHSPICQKTKLLSIECNAKIRSNISGAWEEQTVHIIRCLSDVDKEKEMFLELVEATVSETATDEEVIETFQILTKFFANKTEPTDSELIGLYAELKTIEKFSESLSIQDYWQSRDRMKFDFSFSDDLKLEVKATTKPFRTHHFKHDQLATEAYNIYVISYMLRFDDEGESLYDLLISAKSLLSGMPKKLLRIETVIKNTSVERLKAMRFSPEYTAEKQHIYRTTDIPRFPEPTPDGVANAEYDCSLENVPYVEDEAFIVLVKEALEAGE